jgi:hypothetical protein
MKTPAPLSQRIACLCALAILMQTTGPVRAATLNEWPLVLVRDGVTNTIYQPQLDSWNYVTLEAHAAVAVQPASAPQATFGVIHVSARTLVPEPNNGFLREPGNYQCQLSFRAGRPAVG